MADAPRFYEIRTTTERREDAEGLVERLVADRLAACAQLIGPIQSTYHWQGKIERSEEWLCLLKTSAALYPTLERAIRAQHPYSVPEILAVPIAEGNPDYLAWLAGELRGGTP